MRYLALRGYGIASGYRPNSVLFRFLAHSVVSFVNKQRMLNCVLDNPRQRLSLGHRSTGPTSLLDSAISVCIG